MAHFCPRDREPSCEDQNARLRVRFAIIVEQEKQLSSYKHYIIDYMTTPSITIHLHMFWRPTTDFSDKISRSLQQQRSTQGRGSNLYKTFQNTEKKIMRGVSLDIAHFRAIFACSGVANSHLGSDDGVLQLSSDDRVLQPRADGQLVIN